jgi:hypothetical protein
MIGAGSVLLDAFAGDPVAKVTVTIPSDDALANDFGRISADLKKAIDGVRLNRIEVRFVEREHPQTLRYLLPTR